VLGDPSGAGAEEGRRLLSEAADDLVRTLDLRSNRRRVEVS